MGGPGQITQGLYYSPERDLGNNYPSIASMAIELLRPGSDEAGRAYRPPSIQQCLATLGVTDHELGNAVQGYAHGISRMILAEVESIRQAFEPTPYFTARPEVRCAILMAIGQVLTGAFFVGIRDTLSQDRPEPPAAVRLPEFVARAVEIAQELERAHEAATCSS